VVYEYTLEAVNELFSRGCPLVILACNTASAKALRTIQQHDLPLLAPNNRVLGVIRPSTEVIGAMTKTGHVGVLATEGTVRSESYVIELHKFSPDTRVVQQACPMWVPLIETGNYLTDAGKLFIQADVSALLRQDEKIDVIVLGCTHYPLIGDYIKSIVPEGIEVVSQGPIVAEKLETYLMVHPEIETRCEKRGEIHFLTSENTEVFNSKAQGFLGMDIVSEHVHF